MISRFMSVFTEARTKGFANLVLLDVVNPRPLEIDIHTSISLICRK